MRTMRKITITKRMTRLERIKAGRPHLMAGRGNAAGIHADQKNRYGKRQRALHRLEERRARQSPSED